MLTTTEVASIQPAWLRREVRKWLRTAQVLDTSNPSMAAAFRICAADVYLAHRDAKQT